MCVMDMLDRQLFNNSLVADPGSASAYLEYGSR